MRSINQFSFTPERSLVSINFPSRSTVKRSLISSISDMRCVIRTTATPSSRSCFTTLNRAPTSFGASEEVGSSKSRTRVSNESARAISTSCCSCCGSDETSRRGSTVIFKRFRISSALRSVSFQSIPSLFLDWLWPIKTFSAIPRFGTRLNS